MKSNGTMTDDLTQALLATWAARHLPARLDVGAAAKLLSFAEHDIPVLVASGKLTPLGDPAPNAPKWFCAVEVIRLGTNKEWLSKATKEISRHWRKKREQHPSKRSNFAKGLIAIEMRKLPLSAATGKNGNYTDNQELQS